MSKKNLRKISFIGLVFLLAFFPLACYKGGDSHEVSPVFSLWTSYWGQNDLLEEVERLEASLEALSYFAVYFNEDGSFLLPDRTVRDKEKMTFWHKKKSAKAYLSFVNDIAKNDGSSSLKDRDLLRELFKSPESRQRHIREIIDLTKKEAFDGLEIDYEALKEDEALWADYLLFLEDLINQSRQEGLLLRVVLEPSAPFDILDFPEGPEYVLMCYNLHGSGSKPGPKANKEFLEKILAKSANLPGQVNYALSTGGFIFKKDASVIALTEEEAVNLMQGKKIKASRDPASQALYFTMINEQEEEDTIWFADSRTLNFWIESLSAGNDKPQIKISLWRAGGNISFEELNK